MTRRPAPQAGRHWVALAMRRMPPVPFIGCVFALAAALCAPLAGAASFPCEQARSAIEKAICASEEISQLDEYLGRYYAGARLALRHATACLAADQRNWLRQVRNPCQDAACLKRAYLERLAVLHAVQPGASSLREFPLPKTPPLVWIVSPASDEAAAPRNLPTAPLAASGRIVDDIAAGDGIVLQTETGDKHLIVSSMLLEEPTAAALQSLARLPGATYAIHGRTDATGAGARAFAAGQCAFVYRTSPP